MKRITLLILFFSVSRLFAQTTAEKIEKTGKKIESTIENIGNLKGVFGKKNKNPKTDANAATNEISAGNVLTAKIAPDAKYIDAERMLPFINGKAIVEKGKSYGVIDTTGNFIIPYNKYKTIGYKGKNLLEAWTADGSVILNNKGVLIADFDALKKKRFDARIEGEFIFIKPYTEKNFTLIDENGKSYVITEDRLPSGKYLEFVKVTEQAIIMKNPDNKKFGFKGLANRLLADVIFDDLSPFKDGFAVYYKLDAYGATKHGIVDINGKITVPPTFSNTPLNLGGGYFRVDAASDADFYYAIINANGDIIFKQSKATKDLIHNFAYYEDGYFYDSADRNIMDTSGRIVATKDFLMKAGLSAKQAEIAYFIGYKTESYLGFSNTSVSAHDGFLVFNYRSENKVGKLGLFNVKTNQILLGPFMDIELSLGLNYNYFIDPASQLMMVEQDTNIEDTNRGFGMVSINGAMSANGQIKIVRAEKKSEW